MASPWNFEKMMKHLAALKTHLVLLKGVHNYEELVNVQAADIMQKLVECAMNCDMEMKNRLMAALQDMPWPDDKKARLIGSVSNSCLELTPRQKMQDYTALHMYFSEEKQANLMRADVAPEMKLHVIVKTCTDLGSESVGTVHRANDVHLSFVRSGGEACA